MTWSMHFFGAWAFAMLTLWINKVFDARNKREFPTFIVGSMIWEVMVAILIVAWLVYGVKQLIGKLENISC